MKSLAGLSQWHLDNWTDDAFREHIPAVRKALAQALEAAPSGQATLEEVKPVAWVDPHTSGSHWPYVCKEQTSVHTAPLYAYPPASGAVEAGPLILIEELRTLDATVRLEAVGGTKAKYAEGRRHLATKLVPIVDRLFIAASLTADTTLIVQRMRSILDKYADDLPETSNAKRGAIREAAAFVERALLPAAPREGR